jgi:phage shock protein C
VNDRLYRSRDERMIAGVAGGIAERYDFDPSLVRIVWAILILVTGGLFLLIYIVMAIVIPEAPIGADRWPDWGGAAAAGAVPGWEPPAAAGAGAAFAATPGPGGEPPAGSAAGSPPPAGADPNATPPASDPPTTPFTTADPATSPSATPPPSMLAGGYTPPSGGGPAPGSAPPWAVPPPRHRHRDRSGSGAIIGGIVLVLIGGYFLLRQYAPQLQLGSAWPIILVIIGFALVLGSFRPGSGGSDGG